MADTSEKNKVVKQEFSSKSPLLNLVEAVDYILHKLGIAESCCRNPSCRLDSGEKISGMTNTYLKPTRIGRKAVLGKADFFYGRKFNLMPSAYELVAYDAPVDVLLFLENRLIETLTDYMSVHLGNFTLNVDIKYGEMTDLVKMGFDGQFTYLSKNAVMTMKDLAMIVDDLLKTG